MRVRILAKELPHGRSTFFLDAVSVSPVHMKQLRSHQRACLSSHSGYRAAVCVGFPTRPDVLPFQVHVVVVARVPFSETTVEGVRQKDSSSSFLV